MQSLSYSTPLPSAAEPIANGTETRPGPRPDLAVVICTRNRAAKLGAALEALVRLQTRRTYEVIVVDNRSTDQTAEVIRGFQWRTGFVKYVRVDRIGLGAARDRGWREARADIISFTDDDCYVTRDYVDRVLEVFEEQPGVAFVTGQIRLWDPEDQPITIDLRETIVEMHPYTFVSTNGVGGANLAFRREVLDRIGGFDPLLGAGTRFPCEDLDVVARAVWCGLAGRFDPRPAVFHHHGRKTRGDAFRIFRDYDRGRGAYYMKFILRPDSRRLYLRAYVRWLLREARSPGDIRRVYRELMSALAYFRQSRATQDGQSSRTCHLTHPAVGRAGSSDLPSG